MDAKFWGTKVYEQPDSVPSTGISLDTNKIALTISNLQGYIDTEPGRATKGVGDEMHGPDTTNTTLWANQKGTMDWTTVVGHGLA
jgi:hypothetical protein